MLYQRWLTVAPWVRTMAVLGNSQKMRNILPNLAIFGAGVGGIALFLIEPTPLVRRDIMKNVPVVGSYWQKKLDESARVD
ncbi:hypothetical protein BJ742DRAFT_841604 [Cladochytrium replicatum]|nr:hypothetical protein BJ742DRAFT_841604 [Cladochytrium replicatum]